MLCEQFLEDADSTCTDTVNHGINFMMGDASHHVLVCASLRLKEQEHSRMRREFQWVLLGVLVVGARIRNKDCTLVALHIGLALLGLYLQV